MSMWEKSEKRIERMFALETSETKAERRLRRLRTDTERMLCAIAARSYRIQSTAIRATEQMTSRELLLEVAVRAEQLPVREHVMDRFAADREFLNEVIAHRACDYRSCDGAEKRLAALDEAEDAAVLSSVSDENTLADMLLRGDIKRSVSAAMEKIDSEEVLLRLLSSGKEALARPAIHAARRKARSDGFSRQVLQWLLDGTIKSEYAVWLLPGTDALLRAAADAPTIEARRLAVEQLQTRMDEAEKEGRTLTLTEAQQDLLLRNFLGRPDFGYCPELALLSQERLLVLYANSDTALSKAKVFSHLDREHISRQLLIEMARCREPLAQARAGDIFRGMSAGELFDLAQDPKAGSVRNTILVWLSRDHFREEGVRAYLDAMVLPMIEAAKTPHGYDGAALLRVCDALPREVAEQYGFEIIVETGESIDGAEWEKRQLAYDGHLYWDYFTQTDGGGTSHRRGEMIY